MLQLFPNWSNPTEDKRLAQKMHKQLTEVLTETMDTVLIVDIDPKRADLIRSLLSQHQINAKRCRDFEEITNSMEAGLSPAIIFVHCALLNYSFTELATLSQHSDVRLLFYCTDADHKAAATIAKLPEELGEVVHKITEIRKTPGENILRI